MPNRLSEPGLKSMDTKGEDQVALDGWAAADFGRPRRSGFQPGSDLDRRWLSGYDGSRFASGLPPVKPQAR